MHLNPFSLNTETSRLLAFVCVSQNVVFYMTTLWDSKIKAILRDLLLGCLLNRTLHVVIISLERHHPLPLQTVPVKAITSMFPLSSNTAVFLAKSYWYYCIFHLTQHFKFPPDSSLWHFPILELILHILPFHNVHVVDKWVDKYVRTIKSTKQ